MSEFKFKIGDEVIITNSNDLNYNKPLTIVWRTTTGNFGNMYSFKEVFFLTKRENNLRKLEDLEDLYV